MKSILLASITCFILTLAAGAFGQNATPTPVFKPKPTPEFKVSVIEEIVLVPVPSSTPRPQLTNNTKIERSPIGGLTKDELEIENGGKTPVTYTPPSAAGKPVLRKTPSWTYIGDSIEGERKDAAVYYRDAVRVYGGIELWVRFVYTKPFKLTKSIRVAYHIGYLTLDCDDRRVSNENTVLYDPGGKIIKLPFSSMFDAYRKPIVPESVGDMIWKEFCRD